MWGNQVELRFRKLPEHEAYAWMALKGQDIHASSSGVWLPQPGYGTLEGVAIHGSPETDFNGTPLFWDVTLTIVLGK